jgi:catechol 2,3-dioxygenase-like lactoylglutathione lyase family enzyme
MRIVPVFKCQDMPKAIAFYTGILDFKLKYPAASINDWVVDLINDTIELQLTVLEGDYLFGSVVNIWVDEVDPLFRQYIQRGLDITDKKDSPVHQGPTDQTWGTREFYITDEDGNTLRFCQSLT